MKKTACSLLLALSLFAQQNPAPPAGGPPAEGGRGAGGRGGRGGGRAAGGGGFGQVGPLEEAGFRPIFDGKTLASGDGRATFGWDCDPEFWRVEGEAIVGETKTDHQPKMNIFCIWRDGTPGNFELKMQYKLTGAPSGNSGIQYRSVELPAVGRWVLKGYQMDIDAQQRYTGQIYEERGRGFLALRGMVSYIGDDGKKGSIGSLGDGEELKKLIKQDDWNDVHIIARGNTIIQIVNGRLMSQIVDDDKTGRKMSGLIGIQLHVTPGPMKIEARNIRLKDM
jgi:hypothetical protein